ncbi:RHS repeat-associated core domain-containing protein [Streptomyces sp. TG1A-60]|uniref:RHS repeat-associated core domain-containing protein n=1 Tax=Streptomyces sp. TG1A-60 TaxID=3129111 RepID=UPI0030D35785
MTGETGDTVLQLTNIHGDLAVQHPLDTTKPTTVLDHDEYGNPRQGSTPARYGWLGGKQRPTSPTTALVLMGVRLYDPRIGRFLSTDPIHGGNANAYEYVHGDPINKYDLDGRHWFSNRWKRRLLRGAVYAGAAFATAGFCAVTGGLGCIVAGAAIGAAWGAGDYWAKRRFGNRARYNRRDLWVSVGQGAGFGAASSVGGLTWKATQRFVARGTGKRRAPSRGWGWWRR